MGTLGWDFCGFCTCHRKPSHILHYLLCKQELLWESLSLNRGGREILPCLCLQLPSLSLSRRETAVTEQQTAVGSGPLQSPALPARILIQRKRWCFRSFPKKAWSLLGSRASLGLFLSTDFPACLAELGRPGGTLAESPR